MRGILTTILLLIFVVPHAYATIYPEEQDEISRTVNCGRILDQSQCPGGSGDFVNSLDAKYHICYWADDIEEHGCRECPFPFWHWDEYNPKTSRESCKTKDVDYINDLCCYDTNYKFNSSLRETLSYCDESATSGEYKSK